MCPIRPAALWTCDLQFGINAGGRTLKVLNIIDEPPARRWLSSSTGRCSVPPRGSDCVEWCFSRLNTADVVGDDRVDGIHAFLGHAGDVRGRDHPRIFE